MSVEIYLSVHPEFSFRASCPDRCTALSGGICRFVTVRFRIGGIRIFRMPAQTLHQSQDAGQAPEKLYYGSQ